MQFQTVNPLTNMLVKIFEETSPAVVNQSIETAVHVFESWKTTDIEQRSALLYKVAGLLREKQRALAELITLEMGKLLVHAVGEIKLSAEIFDYYAKNAGAFLADEILHPIHGQALVRSSPIGVLLGIQPWNFPFYQVARFAAPNIMVGNPENWRRRD
jgi:succinate-semialdehyde dehydrogenase / glutarate-semialdehyde dehydrogenase